MKRRPFHYEVTLPGGFQTQCSSSDQIEKLVRICCRIRGCRPDEVTIRVVHPPRKRGSVSRNPNSGR